MRTYTIYVRPSNEKRRKVTPDGSFAARMVAIGVSLATLRAALARRRRGQAQAAAERATLLAREQEARAAAERATRQLQAVLDVLPAGVIIADATGRLLQANEAARALWGETPLVAGVAEYRAYKAWWPGTGRPLAPDEWAMARAIATGEVCPGEEVEIETFDGERKTALNTAAPIRDEAGEIVGGVVAMLDITARKGLERQTKVALDALLAMAEALVRGEDEDIPTGDGAESGIDAADAAARRLATLTRSVLGCQRVSITAVDPRTGASRPVAVVGISPDEERAWRAHGPGASLRDYLDETQLKRLLAEETLVVDVSAQPERPLPYGVRSLLLALLRVGTETVGVLSLDHGAVAHTYTVDEVALARAVARLTGLVLERGRLLRERAEARANALALREANRRMDAFLALASHELKTPLTSISGNIQLAERRLDQAVEGHVVRATDLAPLLGRARRNLKRMDRLVDDLLDMSRIQADHLQLRLDRYDLAAVVRDAVDERRQLDPTRAIRLELPAESPIPMRADGERIGQVVLNYLTNALKYAPPERSIDVGVRVEGAEARVWVRDEGPGLSDADQRHIWDRFYRVKGVEHQSGSSVGLGLGLYISKTIVERHGGRVGVESAPGAGATFWFTLPLAPPD